VPKNLPDIDEQRIQDVFTRLEGMEVELDPDPLAYGPKRLNGKVALARKMLTQCERIFLQVSHDLQLYKRAHRGAQLDFDLQMQDLLANDIDVRAGRNVRDRDAIATMKLHQERRSLMDLEVSIQDLDMVMSVVKAKRADLRDIQSRIRDQIKLCQEEIGLGGKWGSKPPEGTKTPDLDAAPKTDQKALEALQEMMVSDPAEVHLEPGDESWMEDDDSEEEGEDDLVDDDVDDEDVAALLREVESDEDPTPKAVETEPTQKPEPEPTPEPASVAPTVAPTLTVVDGDMSIDDLIDSEADLTDMDLSEVILAGGPSPKPEGKAPVDWEDLEQYPLLGYCDVCGEPAHDSPGGSLCKNGHGGAPYSSKPPEAEEPVPGPEPKGPDIEELFSAKDVPPGDEPLPAVTTEQEVDDFFNQLQVDAAKPRGKKSPAAPAEDLDDLLSLFSDE